MAKKKKLSKVENFIELAKGSGIPLGFVINMTNLWNELTNEEKGEIIDREECF